jgi:hypothetical protein
MKLLHVFTALAIICGATFQYGCATAGEVSPDERRWKRSVESRFDLEALRDFLRRTSIAEQGFAGVQLDLKHLDRKWEFNGQAALLSEDWIFYLGEGETFTLIYTSGYAARGFAVAFECERQTKTSFRLVRIRKDPYFGWRS